MKIKLIILLLVLVGVLFGCSNHTDDDDTQLKIAATTWVGFLPLFYAEERGWLNESNVRLVRVSTLTDGMLLFDADKVDVLAGTQYEYVQLAEKQKQIKPLLLVDRSNGGDMILSNRTLSYLQETDTINVYLETDSVNKLMLLDFIKKYNIPDTKLRIFNKSQTAISDLKNNPKENMMIVTYHPFDIQLKKNGFREILSTSSGVDIIVVDLFMAKNSIIVNKPKKIKTLVWYFNVATDKLENDPLEFYNTVRAYIPEYTYEEFLKTTKNIKWINRNIEPELVIRLKEYNLKPVKINEN